MSAAREAAWREQAAAALAATRAARPWGDNEAMPCEQVVTGSTRPASRAKAPTLGRLATRFTPRQRPRSPDRKASRERRRMLGGSGVLPANLRCHYTLGMMAVLCIIAGEVKHHGVCDLPIDKIAALAGVCRTTVQTTLHEARRLLHIEVRERPRPGRKHLPNEVRIISREWIAWIRRAPSAHKPIGSNSLTQSEKSSPTKIINIYAADAVRAGRPQGVDRKEPWARSGPRYGAPMRPGRRGEGKSPLIAAADKLIAELLEKKGGA